MTTNENIVHVRRELMRFRYDPEFHGPDKRVSIRGIAELVGCSRGVLYLFMRKGALEFRPSQSLLMRLNFAIDLVNKYGVRWHYRARTWRPMMPDGTEAALPLHLRPTRKPLQRRVAA